MEKVLINILDDFHLSEGWQRDKLFCEDNVEYYFQNHLDILSNAISKQLNLEAVKLKNEVVLVVCM